MIWNPVPSLWAEMLVVKNIYFLLHNLDPAMMEMQSQIWGSQKLGVRLGLMCQLNPCSMRPKPYAGRGRQISRQPSSPVCPSGLLMKTGLIIGRLLQYMNQAEPVLLCPHSLLFHNSPVTRPHTTQLRGKKLTIQPKVNKPRGSCKGPSVEASILPISMIIYATVLGPMTPPITPLSLIRPNRSPQVRAIQ